MSLIQLRIVGLARDLPVRHGLAPSPEASEAVTRKPGSLAGRERRVKPQDGGRAAAAARVRREKPGPGGIQAKAWCRERREKHGCGPGAAIEAGSLPAASDRDDQAGPSAAGE